MIVPTGKEVFFDRNDIIVSKTDLKGRITYANKTFCEIAGYVEAEVIGQPHSMIRHPDMPRCIFKLLWEAIAQGREIFAYVKNMGRNGDHYWVLAHVTPSFDGAGEIVGYHSTRRVPDPDTIQNAIVPLYRELKAIEDSHANRKDGLETSYAHLVGMLDGREIEYDEYVSSLQKAA